MTFEKAIEKLTYARQNADDELDAEWCASLDIAIKALEAWDNLFKSYEILTKEITESEDIKNATKRIDDWCIEQLRGIIGDYYADSIIKENEI